MKNPYASRWMDLHSKAHRGEKALAYIEAQDAEDHPVIPCGKCSGEAFYRPGVGAYQCSCCRAVRSYSGEWR